MFVASSWNAEIHCCLDVYSGVQEDLNQPRAVRICVWLCTAPWLAFLQTSRATLRKLGEFSSPGVSHIHNQANSLMNTTSRAEHVFSLYGWRVWRHFRGWSHVCLGFFPTYFRGYIQHAQYLSTSPNSNQSSLSSITLHGCNFPS